MPIPVEIKQKAHALITQGEISGAKAILLAAIDLDPEDIDILLALGVVHLREGDLTGAEKWLVKAVDTNPDNPTPYIHLANTLLMQERFDDAILNYQAAISLQPDLFEAHFYLANLLMTSKQLEDAEYHYNYALHLQPDNADCHANLGQIYELQHRLDDARTHATKALRLQRDHIGALLLLGKLEKRERNYTTAAALFRQVLAASEDDALIGSTYMELGHILDRLSEYDAAYTAYTAGNNAWTRLAETVPFDRDTYQKLIHINREWFCDARISQWESRPENADAGNDPVFFVGFPRSGTTLVEQILNQHPAIVTSDEKPLLQDIMGETPGLPEALENASDWFLEDLRKLYWDKAAAEIDGLVDSSILVDKLPLNIVHLGFIARVFPKAHILVAIRDPRDVCLSCYMQGFTLNPAMINFLSMESTVSFYTDVMDLWQHYRTVLPLNWHQYRYEDLIDDFDTTTRGIFMFLGLDYPENTANYYIAASRRQINTPSYQDVTSPAHGRSMSRWKNYEKYLAPYMDNLASHISEYGY